MCFYVERSRTVSFKTILQGMPIYCNLFPLINMQVHLEFSSLMMIIHLCFGIIRHIELS